MPAPPIRSRTQPQTLAIGTGSLRVPGLVPPQVVLAAPPACEGRAAAAGNGTDVGHLQRGTPSLYQESVSGTGDSFDAGSMPRPSAMPSSDGVPPRRADKRLKLVPCARGRCGR